MSNSVRRQNLGLGKTAAGGSGGSFASHDRAAAAPPFTDRKRLSLGNRQCQECGDSFSAADGSYEEHMATYHFLSQEQVEQLGKRFDIINDGADVTLVFEASNGSDQEDVFAVSADEFEEIGWQKFMHRATQRDSLGFDEHVNHDFHEQITQLRERVGTPAEEQSASVLWCANAQPHPPHSRANDFGGRDQCSGMPEVNHAIMKQCLAEFGIQSTDSSGDHLLPTAPNGGTWRIEMEDIPHTSRRDAQLAIADQIEQFDADELFEELWDEGEVRRSEPGLKPSVFLGRLQSDERYFKNKAAEMRGDVSSPHSIAERLSAAYPVALETQADIRGAMIAAIEADRAARGDSRP